MLEKVGEDEIVDAIGTYAKGSLIRRLSGRMALHARANHRAMDPSCH